MSRHARVSDIKALASLRPSLIRFSEDVQRTLTSPGTDAGRVLSWMQQERLPYWKREIRVRSEEAVRANTKLVQQTASSNPRPSVDAQKAYEFAKRRVREAEEMYDKTRQSILKLDREIKRYRGAVQPMASIARSDMMAAVAKLDGYIAALDAYTATDQSHTAEVPKDQKDVHDEVDKEQSE